MNFGPGFDPPTYHKISELIPNEELIGFLIFLFLKKNHVFMLVCVGANFYFFVHFR